MNNQLTEAEQKESIHHTFARLKVNIKWDGPKERQLALLEKLEKDIMDIKIF